MKEKSELLSSKISIFSSETNHAQVKKEKKRFIIGKYYLSCM